MSGETVITIVGNLTDAPELRFTPSGAGVCKFRVASTPRTFDRQTSEWRDGEPLFLDCQLWRDAAEHVAESLDRGARVIVQGRLRQESWEDKNGGGRRSKYVLEVDEIGPSLRYATAKVQKMQRSGGQQGQGQRPQQGGGGDPWATQGAQPSRGAGAQQSSSFDDSPPF
jgi:single-strand DNA-binding protein